ncbi:MAG: hypothetical protein IGS50_12510 [Synechococcales cyanobacterium C42_A2020_086]|jgi:chromosome segregation ATPase|nr:hypothetical protein [Synechococcales cyanobacterium C42_A2020_086]
MKTTPPFLKEQIATLQAEAAEFEAELEKRRAALDTLLQFKIEPKDRTPAEIARAIAKTTEQRGKNQPQVEGLKRAIEELQQELQSKRELLDLLLLEQSKQLRQEKMEAARNAVKSHIKRIQAAGAALESELWNLKAVWQEHRQSYIDGQSNPHPANGYGYRWQPNDLVQFGTATIPELVETPQGFALQPRDIGLFNTERMAAIQEDSERRRQSQLQRQESRLQLRLERLTSTIRQLEAQIAPLRAEVGQQELGGSANDQLAQRRAQADLQRLEQELQQHQQELAQLTPTPPEHRLPD